MNLKSSTELLNGTCHSSKSDELFNIYLPFKRSTWIRNFTLGLIFLLFKMFCLPKSEL